MKIHRTSILLTAALLLAAAACKPFTRFERTVINQSDSLMYVTVIDRDSVILRTPSRDLDAAELRSGELATLLDKMLYTVQHPSQDGVGIAAPQVGINRRIICVQRFDKAGAPFESYLNIRIDSLGGETGPGPEGCLSVPGLRGIVTRHSKVHLSYIEPVTLNPKSEVVEGYTAVIFQHECDHLDGVLYIDRADTVFVSEQWVNEREKYSYERPAWFK